MLDWGSRDMDKSRTPSSRSSASCEPLLLDELPQRAQVHTPDTTPPCCVVSHVAPPISSPLTFLLRHQQPFFSIPETLEWKKSMPVSGVRARPGARRRAPPMCQRASTVGLSTGSPRSNSRAIIANLADSLDALPCDAEGLFDDGFGQGEAGRVESAVKAIGRRLAAATAAILSARGAAILSARGGGRRRGRGIGGDVVEDAAEQGRVCGDLAGAQEGESVGVDGGGPVGGVRVEGVEKGLVDSVVGRGERVSPA